MKKALFPAVLFSFMAMAMPSVSFAAPTVCPPKVDNFILFVDQSGTMYMNYEKASSLKMAVAKQLLLEMNAVIPEAGYNATLDLFAPFQEIQSPVVYNRAALGAAIKTIKDNQDIYGRQTPMPKGILSAEQAAVLERLKGRTAVIMLSDGKSNVGGDPAVIAQEVKDKHPKVVFHVISFAQPGVKDSKTIAHQVDPEDEKGAAINRHLAGIGHGVFVEASSLYNNPAAMQKFVNDVFCGEAVKAAEVTVAPVQQKIVLRGIQFDFDKSNIKPEFQPILDEAVSTLKAKPGIEVVIAGHTDSVGTPKYNIGLSNRRAKGVDNYFVANGIAAGRLETVGHGLEDPIATNATAEGRTINRRVELPIVK